MRQGEDAKGRKGTEKKKKGGKTKSVEMWKERQKGEVERQGGYTALKRQHHFKATTQQ